MFYRLRIDLAFPDLPSPNTLKDLIEDFFDQAVTINPGSPNEERGYVILEECHHDETPTIPCIRLSEHYTPSS